MMDSMLSACHAQPGMLLWSKTDHSLLKRLGRLHDALSP